MINAGSIPKLVDLLSSQSPQVSEQAVWALGNIAGDGPAARDLVISAGAIPPLLELAKSSVMISTLRNVVWTISNLCRNKNQSPPFDSVKVCLPMLYDMLHSSDKDVLGK